MKPIVSIIVTAYNREKTIVRTLQSILNQTWQQLEVIVVDDGSTDHTMDMLNTLTDERIRIIQHRTNKGATAAKNSGLNAIQGEWFTLVDSDDEIVSDAIETLMRIPMEVDQTINAVDSAVFETETNQISELCFMQNQYVNEGKIIRECIGDVWGITKTTLLGNDRFNEKLMGWEDVLWYKLNARANRYYLHQKLYIYHTEGNDRISKKVFDLNKLAETYKVLLDELFFLNKIKQYNPGRFIRYCKNATIYLAAYGDKRTAKSWLNQLKQVNYLHYMLGNITCLIPSMVLESICSYKNR